MSEEQRHEETESNRPLPEEAIVDDADAQGTEVHEAYAHPSSFPQATGRSPEDGEPRKRVVLAQGEPAIRAGTAAVEPRQIPAQRSAAGGGGRLSWWFVVTALATGLVLGVGALAALNYLARPLAMLVLAVAIALALDPLVDRLSRGRLSRSLASVLVFLVLILIFALMGWLIVPSLVTQAGALIERIPRFFELVTGWLEQQTFVDQDQITGGLFSRLGTLTGALVSLPLQIFSSLLDVLLMLFIALYWLILIPKMKGFVLSLFPKSERPHTNTLLKRMGSSMGGYVRGSVINGLIVGVLTYLGLLIIGVDYALALSLLAGMLELVPILGPLIAGAVIIASALLQSPGVALLALVYILIMQQLESNILVPNIMRSQANISPLLVLLAVYAGSAVGGLIGALAAIPLAGALQVLVTDVIAPAIRRSSGAAR